MAATLAPSAAKMSESCGLLSISALINADLAADTSRAVTISSMISKGLNERPIHPKKRWILLWQKHHQLKKDSDTFVTKSSPSTIQSVPSHALDTTTQIATAERVIHHSVQSSPVAVEVDVNRTGSNLPNAVIATKGSAPGYSRDDRKIKDDARSNSIAKHAKVETTGTMRGKVESFSSDTMPNEKLDASQVIKTQKILIGSSSQLQHVSESQRLRAERRKKRISNWDTGVPPKYTHTSPEAWKPYTRTNCDTRRFAFYPRQSPPARDDTKPHRENKPQLRYSHGNHHDHSRENLDFCRSHSRSGRSRFISSPSRENFR